MLDGKDMGTLDVTPVAVSVIVKDGVPPEQRVPLVVASLLLKGPMALAPALVAVERHRSRAAAEAATAEAASGGATPAPSNGPVGPALVKVPDLTNPRITADAATEQLKKLKLGAKPMLNQSEERDKGFVIAQPALPAVGSLVEEGRTTIAFNVGAGAQPPPPVDEATAIADLRRDMGTLVKLVTELVERSKPAAAGTPSPGPATGGPVTGGTATPQADEPAAGGKASRASPTKPE